MQKATHKLRPIAIDLFAGAGGLALGLEQAGFDVVASFDYDPVHCAVHVYNFPLTTVKCADLSVTEGTDVISAAKSGWDLHHPNVAFPGEVDVIVGGPPCQGFSMIGKRLVDDRRNALVFHFMRIVCEVRPHFFVMENVPGMMTGGHKSILSQLIEEFEEAGYFLRKPAKLLNAANYGVPQNRERVFLVGSRESRIIPEYPHPRVQPAINGAVPGLFDGEEIRKLPQGPTVMDALGDLPDLDDFASLLDDDSIQLEKKALQRMEKRSSSYARALRGMEKDKDDLSYPRIWDRGQLTGSRRTRHTRKSIKRFSATPPGDTEAVSRFYRLPPKGLSNTIRSGTGSERGAFTSPRPIHPSHPRVISVREAARLHSYPDWFRFHTTKWHGFRQIGNSVPPLLARAVGSEVIKAMGVSPPRPRRRLELGAETMLTFNMTQAAEYFGAESHAIPQPRQRENA